MKKTKIKTIAIFEGSQIRRHWDAEKELWYFSVVDAVRVLTKSADPRNYWKVLKIRLKAEGSELVTKCNQLKMQASDGKLYLTDTLDTEVMLRLIQSIPSPNAEPFKLWLARVGYERLEETEALAKFALPELKLANMPLNYQTLDLFPVWVYSRSIVSFLSRFCLICESKDKDLETHVSKRSKLKEKVGLQCNLSIRQTHGTKIIRGRTLLQYNTRRLERLFLSSRSRSVSYYHH